MKSRRACSVDAGSAPNMGVGIMKKSQLKKEIPVMIDRLRKHQRISHWAAAWQIIRVTKQLAQDHMRGN